MSRSAQIIFICNNINSKRLIHEDRFDIACYIAEIIGVDKIINKGPDCAIYLENLTDANIATIYDMITEKIEKNNEIIKKLYKVYENR